MTRLDATWHDMMSKICASLLRVWPTNTHMKSNVKMWRQTDKRKWIMCFISPYSQNKSNCVPPNNFLITQSGSPNNALCLLVVWSQDLQESTLFFLDALNVITYYLEKKPWTKGTMCTLYQISQMCDSVMLSKPTNAWEQVSCSVV